MATSGSAIGGYAEPPCVWDKFQVYQGHEWQTPVILIGTPPPSPPKLYPNPIKMALEYKKMMEAGQTKSQAELVRHLGTSRAKVTQMLNLLKLDGEIQEFILGLSETDERLKIMTERKLRPLAILADKEIQRKRFWKLVGMCKK